MLSVNNIDYSNSLISLNDKSSNISRYINMWEKWVKETPEGSGEQRDLALARLHDCLERGDKQLVLTNLYLNNIPELPPDIVSVYNNQYSPQINLPHVSKENELYDNIETIINVNESLEKLNLVSQQFTKNHQKNTTSYLGRILSIFNLSKGRKNKDADKDEFIIKGEKLGQLINEVQQDKVIQYNQKKPYYLNLKSKKGVATGLLAATSVIGTAYYYRHAAGEHQSNQLEPHLSVAQSSPSLLAPYDESFSAFSNNTLDKKSSFIRRGNKRHVTHHNETLGDNNRTVNTFRQDEVKIEKLYDFSCIYDRENITIAGFIRQVGETLSAPITTLIQEIQVIHHHNTITKGCPSKNEQDELKAITSKVDAIWLTLISLLPGSHHIVLLQQIIGPTFKLIANDLEGKPWNTEEVNEIIAQIDLLSKEMIKTLTPTEINSLKMKDGAISPINEKFYYENSATKIKINNVNHVLYDGKNNPSYIKKGSDHIGVFFDSDNKVWSELPKEEVKEDENNLGAILYSKDEVFKDFVELSFTENGIINIKNKENAENSYVFLGESFIKVNSEAINQEDIVYTTLTNSYRQLLIKSENRYHSKNGWLFEKKSADIDVNLEYVLNNIQNMEITKYLTTTIQQDNYSYNNFGEKLIKYKNGYYKSRYDNEGEFILNGNEKHYFYKDAHKKFHYIKTEIKGIKDNFILLNEFFISINLYNDIKVNGQEFRGTISLDGSMNNNIVRTELGEYGFYLEGVIYKLVSYDPETPFYSIKNKDSKKQDINVYRMDHYILRSNGNHEEDLSQYENLNSCKVKRQMNDELSCNKKYISKKLYEKLNNENGLAIDEKDLEPVKENLSLYKGKNKENFFFQFINKYFPSRPIRDANDLSNMNSLLIFKKEVAMPEIKSDVMEEIVFRKIDQSVFIKEKLDELRTRTYVIDAEEEAKLLNSEQEWQDNKIKSEEGLNIITNTELTPRWSLLDINLKVNEFRDGNKFGSEIDVTFKLSYNGKKGTLFEELPKLQWIETIKAKDDQNIWTLTRDMYDYNPSSRTFLPWLNRYNQAHDFAKIKNKVDSNNLVKIYNSKGGFLKSNDILVGTDPEERTQHTINYLQKNGGVLIVTIKDIPSLNIRDDIDNRERVINFCIGFNEKCVVNFNQGILIEDGKPRRAFVTTKSNINLAHGDVNASPPSHYLEKKPKILFTGERE